VSPERDPIERLKAGRGYVEGGWPVAYSLDPDFVSAMVEVSGRSHLYEGFSAEGCLLGVVDRELIATTVLAMQGRPYFAYNHVVRLDKMGIDRQLFLDAFAAGYPVGGLGTVLNGLRAFMMADGLMPTEIPLRPVRPVPAPVGAPPPSRGEDTAGVLRYAEERHPSFLQRLENLANEISIGELLPLGPRELPSFLDDLIPTVMLASRNAVQDAAGYVQRALGRGATPRHVMEAAESAAPMSGFPTILLTLQALRVAQTG
jgi:alkylhydroperoxidase/carboxymuconolactone decarboxylase family protein YurZ